MTSTLNDNLGALARCYGVHLRTDAPASSRPAREISGESHEWVRTTVMSGNPAAVILVGAAPGTLEAIARYGRPIVIAVQPDAEAARRLLEETDWQAWIDEGRLAVLAGPDVTGMSAVARALPVAADAPIHLAPGAEEIWPALIDRMHEVASQLRFESSANQGARRALAGRYLVHTLSNAARIAREGDAARLDGLAAAMPAVIAAAGPSLDDDIHDIHRVRDRALLIACDTALRPLVSVGLEPHFVVALDPSLSNACHLGGLHVPSRTWLVGEGSLHPSAFALFERRTFFFRVADHHPWPWLRSAGIDCGQLEVWGSVVTGAFDLALRMGCSPIIFAGTDLAFTGGRPYCRGTTLEAQWASWMAGGETSERAFEMLVSAWPEAHERDLHGSDVRTAPHLIAFRDWLLERARRATPVQVFNATRGGILHGPGVTVAHAGTVLSASAALDFAAFDRRVRTAHQAVDRRAALFTHIAALGAIARPAPLAAWRAGTSTTLSDRELMTPLAGPEFSAWALAHQAPIS
jgi:hypothetical protein